MMPADTRSDAERRQGSRRVEANARLTAGTAVVLLILLAVEGATVLQIHQLLTVHVVVGLLLVHQAYHGHKEGPVTRAAPPAVGRSGG
jgi:hypothetical protein